MVSISIVSPSLNQASFVQRTLDSIAAQTFTDYEHIVFDGGSTDGTLDILARTAAGSKAMSLHVGEDSGQANAINLGLRAAQGDILTWLNTDDVYVDSCVLSEIARLFEENLDRDVVYGRGRFIAPDGTVLRDAYINHEAPALLYRFINSVGILQPALFFRRDVLQKCGLLDEQMSCAFDYEYWARLVSSGVKFYFHDRFLVHAIWHDQMKTSAKRGQSFEESIEVCKRYYGFSPLEWVERHSGYLVAGSDYVISDKGKNDPQIREEVRQHAVAAFQTQNDTPTARSAILRWAHANEATRSLREMQRSTGLSWDHVITTTFDEAYFAQGLTLIASLHRTAQERFPIIVYDLGLSQSQRGLLAALRDVFVVDYPRDLAPEYSEFFEAKSYVYKILAINHAAHFVERGHTVLWIDAGVAVTAGLESILKHIARDGVFFVDHDDRPMWPMHNMTFTSDACIEAMNATNDDLIGLHLCSCLMGYKVGGPFQSLFSQALVYVADPRAALGDKHPPPPVRVERARGGAANSKRQRALEDPVFRSRLDRASMRDLFGYLGHRQDQTILSILAARYKAPLSSARKYCTANDESSRASKMNWDSGGFASNIRPSLEAGEAFERSVSIHHRGIYMDLEHLDFGVTVAGPAIVLGNGPSLKGFDFNRLKPFDVFGMNAAYRYWDEIGWYPRFYSCLDLVVGISHAEQIARLIRNAPEYGIQRFLLRRKLIDHIGAIQNAERIIDFDLLRSGTRQFSRLPITTGSHTLIWAASLGFREICLLGVDCNYVEIVTGAERREGMVLEITRASENPNYFFAGYQQVGDKYNIPNSTSPDLHLDSWRAAAISVQESGARVLNANLKSRVDAFDFARFEDFESRGRIQVIPRSKVVGADAFYVPPGFASVSFERSEAAQINECKILLHLMGKAASRGVMLDVGAHRGGSLEEFAKAGWTIYAFEPDPQNREGLEERFGGKRNIVISEEAVSDRTAQNVPFFASHESTGISGLSAFRSSHREVARVRTVTLSEVVARHGLSEVDLLKIDAEGSEMAVLCGLDFSRLKPSMIVAEFEDLKTDCSSHDIAHLLIDKGYTIYVSEWHPIERYGVKHSWRRVQKYPCAIPKDSWGNLIAFLDDPLPGDLIEAVGAAADRPVQFVGYAAMTDTSTISPAATASKAAPHGELPNSKSRTFRKRQQTHRQMSRLAQRPLAVGCVVVALALLVAAVATRALPASWLGALAPNVLFYLIAVNLLFSAIVGCTVYAYSRSRFKALRKTTRWRVDDIMDQLNRRAETQERLAKRQEQLAKTQEQLAERITTLDGRVSEQSLAFSRLNASNASRARSHVRRLDDSALAYLAEHWAPLFRLQFRPSALAYLAHQICLAEDRCEGRLATTIETAMLRLLALRSLEGPEADLLEIGTLFGLGAGLLHRFRGDRITRLRLTLVDPLNGYYGPGELDPITGVMVCVDTLMRNMHALDVPKEDIVLLKGLSTDMEIIAAAKRRSYHLALIDGDHSGEGVRRDFEIYGPLIRPGGLVLFDDYDTTDWPEIKPAVDDLMRSAAGWEWLGADWRTGIARRVAAGPG